MSRSVSDSTMLRLSAFLVRQMGLNYPPERWSELERGIRSAAGQFGFQDIERCIEWLMSAHLSRRQVETLAGFLTVGETYFYRDPLMLEIAEQELLPAVVKARRGKDQRLRLWSAGCSTGEEAYSLAILLHRVLPDIEAWSITVLATDINPTALQKGSTGSYGRWSFRNTPEWFKSGYFSAEEEERFRVAERIRRLVSFQYLNLAEDSYPSLPTNTNAMDVIFCRNVLMYFDPEMAQTVVEKLRRSLVDGGWLIVGAAETRPRGYHGFDSVTVKGATCYRKRGAQNQIPLPETELREREELPEPAVLKELRQEPLPAEPGPEAPPQPVAPSLYQRGRALYRQGAYQEAVALLRREGEVETMPADAMGLLIRCEANQGRLREALEVCDRGLKTVKLDPALHYLRAEILQELGMKGEAQLALQRALFLDPDMVLAHYALGNLNQWGGKGDRARRHFQNAVALLDRLPAEAILLGSEGVTAGRLKEIILSMSGGPTEAAGRRR